MSEGLISGRLIRAEQQIDQLRAEISECLVQGYRVIGDPQPSAPGTWRWAVKAIKVTDPPLVDWAVRTGEIVHNLRAYLDNVAYALAGGMAHGGTAFPLTDTKDDWAAATISKKGRPAKTAGIRREALRAVQEAQPYFDRKNQPLSRLRDLSNWDKHRTLQMAVVGAYFSRVQFSAPTREHLGAVMGVEEESIRPRATFDDSTVFAVVTAPKNMEVKPQVTVDAVFAQGTGAANRPVIAVLSNIAKHIDSNVRTALEPFI